MQIQNYVRVIRTRWRAAVAAFVACVIGAAVVTLLMPTEYRSTATLYVSALNPQADNVMAVYQGSLLSEQRVKSYAAFVESDRVADGVRSQLNLTESAGDISGQIETATQTNTTLIAITVTDGSPDRAAAIATSAANNTISLINDLEKPSNPRQPPTVSARVVDPAVPAPSPSSPDIPANLLIGLLAGLAAAIALPIALDLLDRTIRSTETLRELTNAPSLGTIRRTELLEQPNLLTRHAPFSSEAEEFRQLRTNLQFINVDSGGQTVIVGSCLPGEGKTSTLCNLAVALVDAGARVVVVDGDLRRPAVAPRFGVDGAVGLTSVLLKKTTARSVTQRTAEGVDVLPSGPLPPNPSELLGSQAMTDVIDELRLRYEYVLVDVPPLLPVSDGSSLAAHTDGLLLVCEYGRTTRSQIADLQRLVEGVGSRLLGTVLNKFEAVMDDRYGSYKPLRTAYTSTEGRLEDVHERESASHSRPTGLDELTTKISADDLSVGEERWRSPRPNPRS